jgi:hypothetical protein
MNGETFFLSEVKRKASPLDARDLAGGAVTSEMVAAVSKGREREYA